MEMFTEAARIVLSIFYIYHGANHFLSADSLTAYAKKKQVPYPKVAVLASGAALLAAGLAFLFLFRVVLGGALAAAFLILAALLVHRFWTEKDGGERANEMSHFLKNVALAAATLLSASYLA